MTGAERTVTTDDGVRLRTRVDGAAQAPALLLLGSLGTDLSMWDPQVEAWSAHHRVVRMDTRGHGASGAPAGPYTIDRLGRDALAVLDAHDVDRADVCGLSLGGVVALWLGAEAPARVRRLVLAGTHARVGTEAAWRERAERVRAEGMGSIADLVLDRFFSPAFHAASPAGLERARATLTATDPEGYAGCCEALATADLRADAGRVRAPALVIVGSDDAATPPEQARQLCALLPDARLDELPGAGHLASLEQPARFAQLVTEELTSPR